MMRLRWLAVAGAVVVLALGVGRVLDTATPVQAQEPSSFAPDRVLVAFRPGTPPSLIAEAHRQGGGQVTQVIDFIGLHVVSVPEGTVSDKVALYRRNPNVRYAEPDYIRSIPQPLGHSGKPLMANDYYFEEQYFLHNTGQQFQCFELFPGFEWCFYQATADADIDAPEGWAISTGNPDVRIAILDTGVDTSHPDLNALGKVAQTENFTIGPPGDGHGHGTHVSGIAAAETNNLEPGSPPGSEEGVAGTAYNSSLIVGKVCDDGGSCADSDIIEGILWAAGCDTSACGARRAEVINMSFGGTENSAAIAAAITTAWARGVVLVAAAGNAGTTEKLYPAALPEVIAVAASDEDDNRASFSTYGDWVTVAAPGNVILSTVPMFICAGLQGSPGDEGCYDWYSGTSMATPVVSGIAALVWDVCPTCTNADVRTIIETSAQATHNGQNFLSWTQHGRVNLHDALSLAQTWSAANTVPIAVNDAYNTNEDTPLIVSAEAGVLANDTDASSDTLTATLVSEPTQGSLTLNPDGSFTYTPTPNANGSDSFTYKANDGSADNNVATVSITITPVNDAPVANDDSASTNKDTPVAISVLANDSDVDGDALTVVSIQTLPTQGTAAVNSDGTIITYTPDPGYTGSDALSYTVSDGHGSTATANVTITVKKGKTGGGGGGGGNGGGGGPRPK